MAKKKKEKALNPLWILFGAIAVIALIVLFSRTPAPTPEENKTAETGAQFGDLITINYALTLENGTIVDTNDPALAKEHDVRNYVKGPYTFILGQSGKVEGFDEALVGMELGESIETAIEPTEPEIILNLSKRRSLRRFLTIPLYQRIPRTTYQVLFNKEPRINDVVRNDSLKFKYQIVNMTNTTVLAKMLVKEGETYTLESTYWPSKVAKITNQDVLFYQMPEENQTVPSPFGPATINLTKSTLIINFQPELNRVFNHSVDMGAGMSIPQQFQVVEIGDTYFTIKRYGLLTDKQLALHAELLNLTENVKKVRTEKIAKTEIITG